MLKANCNREETRTGDSTTRKRLRSDDEKEVTNSTDEETDQINMLMLKAEALVQLHQPLEALQSINRYKINTEYSEFCPTLIIRS